LEKWNNPVDGKNQWLWVFRIPEAVAFRIGKSRGSATPVEVLGDDCQGVLVSDFFSAYNKVGGKKKKCLVHLQREMRGWGESENFEQRLINF
jgi:transposase